MKHAEAYTELHCAFFITWIGLKELKQLKKNNTNIAMISSPSI